MHDSQQKSSAISRINALRALSPPIRNNFSTPPPARSNSTPPSRNFDGSDQDQDYINSRVFDSQAESLNRQLNSLGLNDEVSAYLSDQLHQCLQGTLLTLRCST